MHLPRLTPRPSEAGTCMPVPSACWKYHPLWWSVPSHCSENIGASASSFWCGSDCLAVKNLALTFLSVASLLTMPAASLPPASMHPLQCCASLATGHDTFITHTSTLLLRCWSWQWLHEGRTEGRERMERSYYVFRHQRSVNLKKANKRSAKSA